VYVFIVFREKKEAGARRLQQEEGLHSTDPVDCSLGLFRIRGMSFEGIETLAVFEGELGLLVDDLFVT